MISQVFIWVLIRILLDGKILDLFKRVLDQIGSRLANWKMNYLAFIGRVTLVKHTLSTIPIYLFLVFRAPKYFLSKVRSVDQIKVFVAQRDGGGIPWMIWANLCKPLGQGRLVFWDLGCFN